MGEAKSRGTFEQRKKEAIKRHEKERKIRYLKYLEKERNKTPEDRKKEQERKLLLAQLIGMSAPYNKYINLNYRK